MPNPYHYNELYMHSQRDPLWGNVHLGHSTATMHGFGCLVSCIAYLYSRATNKDIKPGDMVALLNMVDGFKADGSLKWDAVRQATGGTLRVLGSSVLLKPFAKYNISKVSFAGQSHFVVNLRNPLTGKVELIYDPWSWPPQPFVKLATAYPKVLGHIYLRTA